MKLVKTSFFSAIVTFIRIASGFVATKIVAVITGPTGVAIVGQFNNFVTIVLTFANGGINTGVVKYTAEYDGQDAAIKNLFSTAVKFSIYCSLVTGALLLAFAGYISSWLFAAHNYDNPIRVLGLTIVLYSLNTFLISVLNGKRLIKKYTLVNTIGSLVGLLFTVILVYQYNILGALYALVLAQSVVFFVTFALVIKSDWFSWSYFNATFDRSMARKLSHYSLMTIVSVICMPVAQIILRNLVTAKLGNHASGYWQGLMRVSDGYLLLITTSLSTYYLPKLASLHTNKELRHEILGGYKIILPAVLLSCLAIYFLRFFIINLLYTKDFEKMAGLFAYQLLGDFFKMAAWVLAYLMLAKAMTKVFIFTEVIFSVTYVVLGVICINTFGIDGITIAFAINYFIYMVAMLIIVRKLLFNKHE